MKIPKEVQCRTCGQVFCCAKCRQKHENNSHQEMQAIRQICYICNNRPFPLRTDTKITPNNLLIQHIMTEHLPLRCNRCSKVFLTASDFKAIVRCTPFGENNTNATTNHACSLEHSPNIPTIMETPVERYAEIENKENREENGDNSNHTDKLLPMTAIKTKEPSNVLSKPKISKELLTIADPCEQSEEPNEALLTPLSKINLRWKRKSQSFDISNGSGNLSALNTSEAVVFQVPHSTSKKLARTTSTPMMNGFGPNAKCSYESYSSVLGQMSSIHHSENDSSYAKHDDHTPASPASYELEKVRAIIKGRSKAAATPLRQVMSKSIQRAIAQHGHCSKMLVPGTQRKMSFNSTGSSRTNSTVGSPSRNAVDLRTTPVLKRASSEICVGNRKSTKVTPLQKSQSEDCGLNQTESQYYETHQHETSLENNSSITRENDDNQKIANEVGNPKPIPSYYQVTPKIAGGILKKVISFTTPEMTRIGEHQSNLDESADLWATPSSVPPRSFSCSALQDSNLNSFVSYKNGDDVFHPPPRSKSLQKLKKDQANTMPSTGKLWSIVSNVIRLASRADVREDLVSDNPEYSSDPDSNSGIGSTFPKNLVQRASSFAGFLRNRLPGRPLQTSTSPESDELPSPNRSGEGVSGKRKRTNSVYSRPYETVAMRPISSPLAKRKRIQGRQPIERMRNSSRGSSGSDY